MTLSELFSKAKEGDMFNANGCSVLFKVAKNNGILWKNSEGNWVEPEPSFYANILKHINDNIWEFVEEDGAERSYTVTIKPCKKGEGCEQRSIPITMNDAQFESLVKFFENWDKDKDATERKCCGKCCGGSCEEKSKTKEYNYDDGKVKVKIITDDPDKILSDGKLDLDKFMEQVLGNSRWKMRPINSFENEFQRKINHVLRNFL